MSVASWHAAGFIAKHMYTDGFFHEPTKWYNIAFGIAGMGLGHGLMIPLGLQGWLQDSDYYPAVVFPFLLKLNK